jgi:hypothetical protein
MDVRQKPNCEEARPLRRLHPRRGRKNSRPALRKPTLPPELEQSCCELRDALLSDDEDTSCRAAMAIQESNHPQLRQRLVYELQVAFTNPNQAVRDRANGWLLILAPHLFGFPPLLDDLTQRLRDTDPKVRAHAAEAIGDRRQAGAPALAALHQALTDPDAEVQFRVAVAIGSITGSIPPKPGTAVTTAGDQAGHQGHSQGKDGEHAE